MIELLVVILVVLLICAFVAPHAGVAVPGGNLIGIILLVLLILVLLGLVGGFVD